jgi:iron uptake system EfeUOB component EfeO/EfeM
MISVRPGSRSLWVLIAVFVFAVCALAGSALVPYGSGKAPVSAPTPNSAHNPLAGRLTSRYGTEVAEHENDGTSLAGEAELPPLSPSAFTAPEEEYRVYARRWIANALAGAASLRRALAGSRRAAAMQAWEATWSDYLHLGAVYGLFGELNKAIDGSPGGLPAGASDPRFTGLHRIEMGLWSGASLRPLIGEEGRLQVDLERLRDVVAHLKITPLEYATRSHEIIEDAQRDLLSAMDVPWSRQGVLGTAAGLAATEEVFHTLEPLLAGRENTEEEVRTELSMLRGVLASIRRHHHGRYPSLSQLGQYEHEQLNGYVAGALSALQEMPGTLETELHHATAKLPPEHG